MIKKKYLTEVEFKNGVDEFKSYRNYQEEVKIKENGIQTIRVELQGKDLKEDSIQIEIVDKYFIPVYWRRVSGTDNKLIEIYLDKENFLQENDTLFITYTAINSNVNNLYSVDYEEGVLYLASTNNQSIECTYEYYNMILEGEESNQLESKDYRTDGGVLTLNNQLNNKTYRSVYRIKEEVDAQYTTPFLKNIKINYLNLKESESF